jgi:YVTN family beta-propeller protein
VKAFLATLLGILAAGCAHIDPSAHGYEIVAKYFVGGPGGWDYVSIDEKRHHLFVGRTDRVQVIDTGTGHVVSELAVGGVHGVAIAQELGLGFTSNGRTDSVTVFDLGTLAVIDTVKVTGKNPDAILYEPLSRRVLTFNGGSANVTVIDAASRKVVGTIAVSGKPEFAVADERGRVFVNIEDRNSLTVIDPAALKVSNDWPLTGCDEPTGLAIDRAAGRLFSVCHNRKMVVVDAKGGEIIASLPIGASVDVETQKSARTSALESPTHRLYLPAASYAPAAAATAAEPRPRPSMIEDSFVILVLAPA